MKSVSYRHKWLICSLACFFTAFLIAVSANTCKQEADASRIAPYVLRFHILAESNSKTDQELKLKVRDQVLSYIREMPEKKSWLPGFFLIRKRSFLRQNRPWQTPAVKRMWILI